LLFHITIEIINKNIITTVVFTDDMYQILKQKVLYNTIGITSNDTIEMKKVNMN